MIWNNLADLRITWNKPMDNHDSRQIKTPENNPYPSPLEIYYLSNSWNQNTRSRLAQIPNEQSLRRNSYKSFCWLSDSRKSVYSPWKTEENAFSDQFYRRQNITEEVFIIYSLFLIFAGTLHISRVEKYTLEVHLGISRILEFIGCDLCSWTKWRCKISHQWDSHCL